MRKIANTSELTLELERLLEYAGSYQPSRVRLANELRNLSMRVAGQDTMSAQEVAKLPVGSIVFQAKDGKLNGQALVVVADNKLTYPGQLPEKAGSFEPDGGSATDFGSEFFLIEKGKDKVPSQAAAKRKAIDWHKKFQQGK